MTEIILILVVVIFLQTSFLAVRSFKKSFNYYGQTRKIYIDSSTLMDGRILNVAKTGFLGGVLIIPRSVLREMQLLADGKDAEKRNRARAGLDIVRELERVVHVDVIILSDPLDHTPVDDRLIQLAKENHGLIMTNDYNLGKVASTLSIDVLNINDLAMELRADYLPGEKLKLKIVAAGSNPKQGVGYLPDGMMVVVDEASSKIGKIIEIEFVRFLQTSSGRMMFAKIAETSRSGMGFVKGRGRKR
jgi:pilT protein domain protein